MPQRNVTTSTPVGYVIATMQALVTSLYSAMQTGKDILASDINSWKSGGYDLWRTHTHTASDRQGIDTFGNLTVYGAGGTDVTATSNQPQANTQPPFSPIAGIASGQQINATDINGMILIANNMRVHNHVITDSIGATAPAVAISSNTYAAYVNGGPATCTLTLANNGQLSAGDTGNVGGQWINMAPTDLATASSYDVRVTWTGNTSPTGTLGTWLNLGTSRAWSITSPYVGFFSTVLSTILVEIRNATTLAIVGTATITLEADSDNFIGGGGTCFPAGCFVLMDNSSWKPIEDVRVGDMVMGVNGPVPVIEFDRPLLAGRQMQRFADGSLRWSEEHAMWTRDQTHSQWWWAANRDMWKAEVTAGLIGGLTDNNTMRTGSQAAEWAHVSGWKANVVETEPPVNPNTRLYLPRTEGSPIIVNGYVVGAGVNQAGFDYTTLDWTARQALLPVVPPLPVV